MPELPEVETTRRGIAPHLQNKKITAIEVRNSRLRWPVDPQLNQKIKGRTLLDIQRRGKYLLLMLDNGATLIWHLGMSGHLRLQDKVGPAARHDHIDLHFAGAPTLRYHDPRRFGALVYTTAPVMEHPLLNHLGPEPLQGLFNGDFLFQKSRKRKVPVKTWLMDSKLVVGVGNIYANESLFAARVHPLKAAGKLSRKDCDELAKEVKAVLEKAIEQGGTTLKDFLGGDGKPGYFAQQLKVYGRGGEPCEVCGKALREKALANRTTVYCTQCQR